MHSSTSSKHSQRSMVSSISESDNKYKKIAKQLVKEREELKQQIGGLSRERDELRHQIAGLRRDFDAKFRENNDKFETVIKQYQSKSKSGNTEQLQAKIDDLTKELDACQKLFNSATKEIQRLNSADKSKKIKQLELENSQLKANLELLTSQNNDNTNNNENSVKQLNEKLFILTQQLNQQKEQIEKDKQHYSSLIVSLEKDKKKIIDSVNEEKKLALQKMEADNSDIVRKLTDSKKEIEDNLNKIIRTRDNNIVELKNNLDVLQKESSNNITWLKNNQTKELEALNKEHETKLNSVNYTWNYKYEELKKETEAKLLSQNNKLTSQYDTTTNTLLQQLRDMTTKLEASEREQKKMTEQQNEFHNQKEKEFADKLKEHIDIVRKDFAHRYETKFREFEDQHLKDLKIIGETDDTNKVLTEQMTNLRENMNRINENTKTVNNQYITSLNKQKEGFELELNNREKIINALKNSLTKLQEESMDRINSLERKVKLDQEEIKDITDKYNAVRKELGKVEQTILDYKTETIKSKEFVDKITEKIRTLKDEKETMEKNLRKIISDRETDIAVFRQQVKDCDNKDIQIAELHSQLQNINFTHRETLNKLIKEHASERKELKDLQNKQMQFESQTAEIERLRQLSAKARVEFSNIENSLQEEHRKQLQTAVNEIKQWKNKVLDIETSIHDLKIRHLKEIEECKKLPHQERTRIEKIDKENLELKAQLDRSEKRFMDLNFEFTTATNAIKHKIEEVKAKEEELKVKEREINNAPPKLLDPMIKKDRDNALGELKRQRVDLTKVKEELVIVTQKLQIAEQTVKDILKEKDVILSNQNEVKATLLANLNQQQTVYEKDLAEKNNRIRELEQMMFKKKDIIE